MPLAMLRPFRGARSLLPWLAAVALAACACTPAGRGASGGASGATTGDASSTAPPDGSNGPAAACDVTNVPGWPRPGNVSTTGIIPVIASSQRVVGPSRMVWTLIDNQNRPIAAPDVRMEIGFFDLCASATAPVQTAVGEFAWGITGVRGFYVTTPIFTRVGTWGAAVVVTNSTGIQTGAKVMFDVADRGTTPAIGSKLPAVHSLTLADVGGDVRKISSDPNPNPDFYRLSVDEALATGTPFVLAMATPAFCQSAQCGPTLDRVKQVVAAHPITTINVEPYRLQWTNNRLQPVLENGTFVLVDATKALGVPTEPWIFVVDRHGTVVGSFEAVFAEDEMTNAIATALATP